MALEWSTYLQAARRHWFVVAFCALLAVAIGSLSVLITMPQYAATMSLYLSYPNIAGGEGEPGLRASDLEMELSHRRLRTVAGFASLNTVVHPVVGRLGLDRPVEQVQEQISARVVPNTLEIEITVTDPDPALAQRLAGHLAVGLAGHVNEIEMARPDADARVHATAVGEPAASGTPVSPRPMTRIGIAALLGLAVGITICLLRQRLDRTIRSVAALVARTGVPNLAVLGTDPAPPPGRIDIARLVDTAAYEPFRQLRTSLQFVVGGGRFPRRLVITSPGPGEGRTATAAHLALTLARAGQRVVLVECDVSRPRLAEHFGLSENGPGVMSVLIGRDEPEWALQPVTPIGLNAPLPLSVVVCGHPPPGANDILRSRAMDLMLGELGRQADVILIDTPPLLPRGDAALLARLCDGAALVVRHGVTTADQVTAALESLAEVDARLLGTVLSDAPGQDESAAEPVGDHPLAGDRPGRPADPGRTDPSRTDPSRAEPGRSVGRRAAGDGGATASSVFSPAAPPVDTPPPGGVSGAPRTHRRRH